MLHQPYFTRARITQFLLFLSTFMIAAVFRGREFGTVSIDYQIFLKLAVATVGFSYAMNSYRVWSYRLLKVDGIFFALFMAWMMITTIWSPNFIYCLTAAFTVVALMPIYYVAAEELDDRKTISTIIASCTLLSIASIAVFYINPEFGRAKAWINGQKLPGDRLTGITGSPNAIGYASALGCLLIISYRLYLSQTMPKIFYLFFAINIVTQLMTNSRASLTALIVSLIAASFLKFKPVRLAALFWGIAGIIIFLAFADLNAIFESLSRTGDASEILTGTGRTYIWAQTLEEIAKRPWTGWGYASASFIMPKLDFPVPHAHNMILQILFVTGIIGLCLFLGALFTKIYYTLKFNDQFKLTLLLFFLAQGIFEPAGFRGVAGTTTAVFILIMAMNYRNTVFPVKRPEEEKVEPETLPLIAGKS